MDAEEKKQADSLATELSDRHLIITTTQAPSKQTLPFLSFPASLSPIHQLFNISESHPVPNPPLLSASPNRTCRSCSSPFGAYRSVLCQLPPPSVARRLINSRQFLLTLFILALTGNVIAEAKAGNHSIINYTMFLAVFAMLSLLYLVGAAIIESIAIPLALLALDAINTLLFLIGGIALAAYLGVHSCSNEVCLTCMAKY
ncbi:MAG: hypothetical protein Q9213_002427 [Squamulea squamosa]